MSGDRGRCRELPGRPDVGNFMNGGALLRGRAGPVPGRACRFDVDRHPGEAPRADVVTQHVVNRRLVPAEPLAESRRVRSNLGPNDARPVASARPNHPRPDDVKTLDVGLVLEAFDRPVPLTPAGTQGRRGRADDDRRRFARSPPRRGIARRRGLEVVLRW